MRKPTFILSCLGFLVGASLLAQEYSIDWYSIDGGGGTSTGGGYTLIGAIGQADAGKLAGGTFELTGGFLGIVTAIQMPDAPLLSVTRSGADVIVSWPSPSTGFILQETSVLAIPSSSTVWSPNGASQTLNGDQLQITIPAPTGNKYFRLYQP